MYPNAIFELITVFWGGGCELCFCVRRFSRSYGRVWYQSQLGRQQIRTPANQKSPDLILSVDELGYHFNLNISICTGCGGQLTS
mmetsp:Transcript_259/g.867  ORF Transcript_259/g.867 Transcript_259/m.867 type:complete len:84 (-) Transcript_259:3456-3707(-)